ncbi:olfactory receptor 5V1-like [Lissotriton helveticus]
MTQSNLTLVTGFVFLGFSDLSSQLQHLFFILFLNIYLMAVMGNSVIFTIITLEDTLHTPMYYLLKNLALVEIGFTSVSVPKMLIDFLMKDKHISFMGCAVQMCLFLLFGTIECFLLALMALDRYVAICIPLRYMTIMSKSKCNHLFMTTCIIAIIFSVGRTSFVFYLPFCKSRIIYHFFCDIPPLLRLSCGNIFANEIATVFSAVVIVLLPLLFILISYVFIITTIARMQATQGRHKAASTCVSHITTVTLFYGTGMLCYTQLGSKYSLGEDRIFAVVYACVIPMLNPLIYSLRNKEVKEAVRKQLMLITFLKIQ